MGQQQARQQALSRGAISSGSSLAPAASGCLPVSSAVDTGPIEGGDLVPVVFTWTHGGQEVYLIASFKGWKEQIPMVRSGNEFAVVQEIPRGVLQYKFIVDEQWRFARDQPKTQDAHGNTNNVLDISNYRRFQAGSYEEEPEYRNVIPNPDDYTIDAPVIPTVLGKSAFSAVPPRPQIIGGQPPNIPPHSLCDHCYLRDRDEDGLVITVTHRHGQKYSTTVFASQRTAGASGKNWLRSVVKTK